MVMTNEYGMEIGSTNLKDWASASEIAQSIQELKERYKILGQNLDYEKKRKRRAINENLKRMAEGETPDYRAPNSMHEGWSIACSFESHVDIGPIPKTAVILERIHKDYRRRITEYHAYLDRTGQRGCGSS